MARIRSIHPEFCTDETLALLSAEAERTFVRLWPHLDDEGRAIDNPKLLKAALYPLHDDVTSVDVEADLVELANVGLILRYFAKGKRVLSAKPDAWARWQKPRHRYDSRLPAPDEPNASDVRPPDVRREPDGDSVYRGGSREGRGEEEGAAADTSDVRPTSAGREQRQRLFCEAVEILVQRHLETHPTKGNPKRHIPATRNGKLSDHADDAALYLDEHPDATAEQLADYLEPPSVVRPTSSETDEARAAAILECSECDDCGVIWVGNETIRCTHQPVEVSA